MEGRRRSQNGRKRGMFGISWLGGEKREEKMWGEEGV